jgi:hypothetical protein
LETQTTRTATIFLKADMAWPRLESCVGTSGSSDSERSTDREGPATLGEDMGTKTQDYPPPMHLEERLA